ncbi:uncharacterized protein LOC124633922 isoform X1 [Helicoverpa zea]|uniref:uncharacterized protein LOC124633922 isoform X1 n=1 Tax=Helicoverpa zea TaxID=7113 RepID=UPI001F5A12F0|nr:uncharacterized protein LOC124633922 isoform X1 [Helicoverpa zea]
MEGNTAKEPRGAATSPLPGTSDGVMSIDPSNVFKVGVRVPPFWAEEPEIWFAQIEGQFSIAESLDSNPSNPQQRQTQRSQQNPGQRSNPQRRGY